MLTVIVDVARVEAFLVTRFGGDVSDVVPLGTGIWSQAFAFRRAGRDYVIRFGMHQEDFAKDCLAARYACPVLPIPRVVALGETFGGYYAIAERVFGEYNAGSLQQCRFLQDLWDMTLLTNGDEVDALTQLLEITDDPASQGDAGPHRVSRLV
jgi:hypothetical protein